MIRIVLNQVPIVIVMDTPPFVGRWSINELLRKYNPGCTIIKITNSLEVAFDVERIVLLDHLQVIEAGNPKRLAQDRLSKIGEMLRLCNEETYIYRNRVSVNPRNFNKKDHYERIAMMLKSKKGKNPIS
jgi:energy-coupling factor transporter ATP-binding protein EcfA2